MAAEILILPGVQRNNQQQKFHFDFVKNFLCEIKRKKEQNYKQKVEFLRQQTYIHYLKKILSEREKNKEVDLPYFLYENGRVLCPEALRKTEIVMFWAEKQGKRHIEKCFNYRMKQLERENKRLQRRIYNPRPRPNPPLY